MASLSGFNANEVEPSTGFDPLPAGDYLLVITDSESKPTKAGTGSYLALTLEVVEGQFQGRKLFHNLNLENPNQQAVDIARAELSAICRAVGVPTPQDSCELHNLPMRVKVGLEKRKDTGEMQNRLKKFGPKNASPEAKSVPTNGSSSAPWKK
jgi:hypothetical protein